MSDKIKKELKDVYNRYAKKRDSAERPAWKNRERQYALDVFLKNKCRSLLEIGAGTCQDSLFFHENGLTVTAIDLSEEHVKCCLEKNIRASAMDLYDLTFDPNSFDCIYSINCFLHIPKKDLPGVLTGVRKVLRNGGLFYLGVYGGKEFEGNLKWTDYDAEERFFSFYELEHYLRILTPIFKVRQSREVRLKEELVYHAFLLEK